MKNAATLAVSLDDKTVRELVTMIVANADKNILKHLANELLLGTKRGKATDKAIDDLIAKEVIKILSTEINLRRNAALDALDKRIAEFAANAEPVVTEHIKAYVEAQCKRFTSDQSLALMVRRRFDRFAEDIRLQHPYRENADARSG